MLTYHHSLADVAVAEVHFDDGSLRTASDERGLLQLTIWPTKPMIDSEGTEAAAPPNSATAR